MEEADSGFYTHPCGFLYFWRNMMNRKGVVYKTWKTDEPSKYYIGVTSKETHEKGSYKGSGILIKLGIKKYGKEKYTSKILVIVSTDKEAYKIEEMLIAKMNPPLNISRGGRGTGSGKNNPFYGKKHSEEAKKKISVACTGKKRSEEAKKKISVARTGKKHSEETKKKISEAHKKRWRKR